MKGIFVTGTDTGVGKTFVSLALLEAFRARGLRTGAMKPCETGCEERGGVLVPADAVLLRDAAGAHQPLEEVCPSRFRLPMAPAEAAAVEGGGFSIDNAVKRFQFIRERHDLTLVEGAGGLLVPFEGTQTTVDLVRSLELPLLVVARAGLGTINHTCLTVACARAAGLQVLGVVFTRALVQELMPGNSGSFRIHTEQGIVSSPRAVVAGGAWSARLLAPLGVRVSLEAERGYHVVFANPGVTLNNSVLDGDKKFVASAMEMGLRCAGTAEFAGLDAVPDYRRTKVIARLARDMLPGLNSAATSEWMGSRPSTPDSLPCIGPVPGHPRLFAAFGHGHLGLTQAPMTARLIAAMVCEKSGPIDIAPYRLDRF